MDKKDFDVILDMSDPEFEEKLKAAIGVKDGDKIEITTPQFDRDDGKKITYFPKTIEEYEFLKEFSEANLRKLGLGVWDKNEEGIHWLYPCEWYNYIPDGMMVTDIMENEETFEKGVSDNDKRFGMLAYGFIQKY